MRIVAILNQKGGVGKTTTAVNLGAALVERGQRVLLVDADPQGNLTDHLGVDPARIEESLYDVLLDGVAAKQAIVTTATPGLDVLPSHADLAAAEQELAPELARETRLRRALATLGEDAYDWVLLDCPPSLGLLSLNAMAAAGAVLITLQTEYFALRGLGQLHQIVRMVQEHVNPSLKLLGILPTLVNPVTNLAREVIEEVRTHYGDVLFRTRIRQNVRLAEAPGHQTHIFAYDPNCPGATDYRALADEVLARASWMSGPAPVADPAAAPPARASRPASPATPACATPSANRPAANGPAPQTPVAEKPAADTAPVPKPPAAAAPDVSTSPTAAPGLPVHFDRRPRLALPDLPPAPTSAPQSAPRS